MSLNRYTRADQIEVKCTADTAKDYEKRIKAAFPEFEKTTTQTSHGLAQKTVVLVFNKKQ